MFGLKIIKDKRLRRIINNAFADGFKTGFEARPKIDDAVEALEKQIKSFSGKKTRSKRK